MARTLTIELTPQIEATLAQARRATGLASDEEAVRDLLLRSESPEARQARREAALDRLQGMFADPSIPPHHPDDEDELWRGTGE